MEIFFMNIQQLWQNKPLVKWINSVTKARLISTVRYPGYPLFGAEGPQHGSCTMHEYEHGAVWVEEGAVSRYLQALVPVTLNFDMDRITVYW